MTFMCKLCKECENVSRCSFESPVFFGWQTMCHGFQTVSEVGKLGVNSKIPRNNILNERLPFIPPGIYATVFSVADNASAVQKQEMHLKICGLCWSATCEVIEGYFGSLIKEPFDHPINHIFKTVEYFVRLQEKWDILWSWLLYASKKSTNNHNWILGYNI